MNDLVSGEQRIFPVQIGLSSPGSRGSSSARQRDVQPAGAQRQRDLLDAAGSRAPEEQDLQAAGDSVLDEPANGAGSGAGPTGHLSQPEAAPADDLLHRAPCLSDTADRHSRDQSAPLLVPGGLLRHRPLERDILAPADRCQPSVAAVGVPRLLVVSQLLRHGSLQGAVQTLSVYEEAPGECH